MLAIFFNILHKTITVKTWLRPSKELNRYYYYSIYFAQLRKASSGEYKHVKIKYKLSRMESEIAFKRRHKLSTNSQGTLPLFPFLFVYTIRIRGNKRVVDGFSHSLLTSPVYFTP
jgi:hypothetical protein